MGRFPATSCIDCRPRARVVEKRDCPTLCCLILIISPGRPDLSTVLTKLHAFRLVEYDKLIFLDADVLPLRPLSHLFSLPHEFSAAPDVGWPDIFNSGVFVFTPGEDKFQELQALARSKGSWDGGDQGLLNEWRGNNWNRLSFTYNTTPTSAYTYVTSAQLLLAITHVSVLDMPLLLSASVPISRRSTSSATTSPGVLYLGERRLISHLKNLCILMAMGHLWIDGMPSMIDIIDLPSRRQKKNIAFKYMELLGIQLLSIQPHIQHRSCLEGSD